MSASLLPFVECVGCSARVPAETLGCRLFHGMHIAVGAKCAACHGEGGCLLIDPPKKVKLGDAVLVVLFDLAWRTGRAFHATRTIAAALDKWHMSFPTQRCANKQQTTYLTNVLAGLKFQPHSVRGMWAVKNPTAAFPEYATHGEVDRLLQLESEAAAEAPGAQRRLQAQRDQRKSLQQRRHLENEHPPSPIRSLSPEMCRENLPSKPQLAKAPPPATAALSISTLEERLLMEDSQDISGLFDKARAAVMKQRHSLQKELERTRNRLRIVEHQLRKEKHRRIIAERELRAVRLESQQSGDVWQEGSQMTVLDISTPPLGTTDTFWDGPNVDPPIQAGGTITASQPHHSLMQGEGQCEGPQRQDGSRTTGLYIHSPPALSLDTTDLLLDTPSAGNPYVPDAATTSQVLDSLLQDDGPDEGPTRPEGIVEERVCRIAHAPDVEANVAAFEVELVGPRRLTRRAAVAVAERPRPDRCRCLQVRTLDRNEPSLSHLYSEFFITDTLKALTRKHHRDSNKDCDFTASQSLGVFAVEEGSGAPVLVAAATVRFHPLPGREGRLLEVVLFAVEETYQHRGVGCLLMAAVKKFARLQGCQFVHLHAIDSKASLAFWSSSPLGFQRCDWLGDRATWYRQTFLIPRRAVAMRSATLAGTERGERGEIAFPVDLLMFPAPVRVDTTDVGVQRSPASARRANVELAPAPKRLRKT
eukprot:EG_transcript_4383